MARERKMIIERADKQAAEQLNTVSEQGLCDSCYNNILHNNGVLKGINTLLSHSSLARLANSNCCYFSSSAAAAWEFSHERLLIGQFELPGRKIVFYIQLFFFDF